VEIMMAGGILIDWCLLQLGSPGGGLLRLALGSIKPHQTLAFVTRDRQRLGFGILSLAKQVGAPGGGGIRPNISICDRLRPFRNAR
jgi:hypothetical protein